MGIISDYINKHKLAEKERKENFSENVRKNFEKEKIEKQIEEERKKYKNLLDNKERLEKMLENETESDSVVKRLYNDVSIAVKEQLQVIETLENEKSKLETDDVNLKRPQRKKKKI